MTPSARPRARCRRSRCWSSVSSPSPACSRQFADALAPPRCSWPAPSGWHAPPPHCPLIFPVFLLYPTHSQSDLIQTFDETTTFADQLAVVLASPPAWDTRGAFRPGNVVVYAETRAKRLLKIPRKMRLADVFAAAVGTGVQGGDRDGLQLKDGLLSFVVLPKGDEEDKWVNEVKQRRDGA